MKYLLDTCVISEWAKPRPEAVVLGTLAALPAEQTVLSSVTVGEIRRGILLLADSRRRQELATWEGHLLELFRGRILPLDERVMHRWAEVTILRQRQGRPLLGNDALIAATAAAGGLTLVTRNVDDFTGVPVPIVNPWSP